MSDWKEISGGVTVSKGIGQQELLQAETFRTPDLALILSDVEAIAAFTTTACRPRGLLPPETASQQVPVLSSAMLGKQTQRCPRLA